MSSANREDAKDLDLVVWGATGRTGGRVARAVAESAPARLRWAVGGRDREGLEALRDALPVPVEVVVADAHDEAALAAMAERSRAVLATVGPFARHGTPLVAACVAAGTDYADLAGEVTWMRRTIDLFHDRARETGARIVHACGFDSVPSDLGLLFLQHVASERHGRPCRDVTHVFGPMSGGVGAGTIETVLDQVERATNDPAARRALADPDLLAPGAATSPSERDPWWPRRVGAVDAWTAPFAMARVNTRVVRRSRALLGEPWGRDFRYRERMRAPNWPAALAVGAGIAVGPVLLSVGPFRSAARRLASGRDRPSDGEGHRGSFRTTLVGRVDGREEPLLAHVESDFDPALGATARMLREVGLGLAEGEFEAPGGVLTPAYVGGMRLVRRLSAAGIRFRAEEPRARD